MSFSDYVVVRIKSIKKKKKEYLLQIIQMYTRKWIFFQSMTVQIFYSFIIIKRKVGF